MTEYPLRAKRILLLGREVLERGQLVVKEEEQLLSNFVFKYHAVVVSDYLRMNESLGTRIEVSRPDAAVFHVMSPKDKDDVLSLSSELRLGLVARVRTANLGTYFHKELVRAEINMFESTEQDLEVRFYTCLVRAVSGLSS